MTDQKKFNHITVTPADDEDIVIVAGVRPDAVEQPFEDKNEISVNAERSNERSNSVEFVDKQPDGGTVEFRDSGKDEYHPTTLKDIEGSKMPLSQKVIIALAICGIAAFAIWYIVANGVIL